MYVFWLAVILWLGSKIIGNDNTHPMLVISFAFCTALSLYTPHMLYISLGIALAGITHPHLRECIKQLKVYQLVISVAVFILVLIPLALGCISNTSTLVQLVFTHNFSDFIFNISTAFAPFFSFITAYDSVFLAPLFGLATVALIIIGILASIGKLFTSRNTVVSLLVIYAILVSGLNQNAAISIVIPIAILTAAYRINYPEMAFIIPGKSLCTYRRHPTSCCCYSFYYLRRLIAFYLWLPLHASSGK